jgi:hypothetical protein
MPGWRQACPPSRAQAARPHAWAVRCSSRAISSPPVGSAAERAPAAASPIRPRSATAALRCAASPARKRQSACTCRCRTTFGPAAHAAPRLQPLLRSSPGAAQPSGRLLSQAAHQHVRAVHHPNSRCAARPSAWPAALALAAAVRLVAAPRCAWGVGPAARGSFTPRPSRPCSWPSPQSWE